MTAEPFPLQKQLPVVFALLFNQIQKPKSLLAESWQDISMTCEAKLTLIFLNRREELI